jgi:transposase
MVTDKQVRRLMKLMQTETTFATAAAKAGMDEKTARKYRRLGKLPSQVPPERNWRTRKNPFEEVWQEVIAKLKVNPGLEAKTLFEDLQRRFPGRFSDGQLRTFQRHVKAWRATDGPAKEVFFPQVYMPGERSQSDFTEMDELRVTIAGQPFDHLVYHFVLPYSNWESGTICFSESFESLSEGLQNALWELGGVPQLHQTDRLSAAVRKTSNPEAFTSRYTGLLKHYGIKPTRTQAASPNENGDVEQRHHRFKRALDQSLMLRGSRDFGSREEYAHFLDQLFDQLNQGRHERLKHEQKMLGRLPERRLEACKRFEVRVGPSSTIRVNHNVYSLDSRLIGESVEVRLFAEHLDVYYGQRCVDRIPRLRGEGRHRIQYRHIIDWLVRKPGAFENYRYREDLFPTHRFRMAFDALKSSRPQRAVKDYLRILHLAALESETAVDSVLGHLIREEKPILPDEVEHLIETGQKLPSPREVEIQQVDLSLYDVLLSGDGYSREVEVAVC